MSLLPVLGTSPPPDPHGIQSLEKNAGTSRGPAQVSQRGQEDYVELGPPVGAAAAGRPPCGSAPGTERDAAAQAACRSARGTRGTRQGPRGTFQLSLSISDDGTLLTRVLSSRLFSK